MVQLLNLYSFALISFHSALSWSLFCSFSWKKACKRPRGHEQKLLDTTRPSWAKNSGSAKYSMTWAKSEAEAATKLERRCGICPQKANDALIYCAYIIYHIYIISHIDHIYIYNCIIERFQMISEIPRWGLWQRSPVCSSLPRFKGNYQEKSMRTQFVPVSIQFPFSFPCFPREIFIPSWSLTPEGTLWRSQVPCSCHGDLLELGLNRPEGLRPIPWEMRVSFFHGV